MAWVTGYTYRQKITIAAQSHISASQTDFPVAVNVPASNADFWANDDGTGSYVRFALLDGTLLKFQVESYDAAGEDAWFHVKVPILSAAFGTDIYIYYGGGSVAGDDKQNTWEANFKGVWHLNQDQAEGAFDDATANNNDGTNTGTTDAAGKIDRARDFNGVNQKIDCGTGASINPVLSDAFTVEAWVDTDVTNAHGEIASNDTAGSPGWNLYINSGGFYRFLLVETGSIFKYSDTNPVGAGWEHVVGTWDGSSTIKTYRNGVEESSLGSQGSLTTITSSRPFLMGLRNNNTLDYNGRLDEVTFSKGIARSADWIVARYQSGLGTWLTFGAQESSGAGAAVNVSGAMAGASTFSSLLTASYAFGGSIPGVALFSAALETQFLISASGTGVSNLSGILSITGGNVLNISGAATAASLASGDGVADIAAFGSILALSYQTSALSALRDITGVHNASSFLTASLTLQSVNNFIGQGDMFTTLVGTAVMDYSLSALLVSSLNLSGDIYEDISFSGSIAGISSASGLPTILGVFSPNTLATSARIDVTRYGGNTGHLVRRDNSVNSITKITTT